MRLMYKYIIILLSICMCFSLVSAQHAQRIRQVADMDGLIAFWDFSTMNADSSWISHYDSTVVNTPFPAYLKRIGDSIPYAVPDWPYTDDDSKILIDTSGPFGYAIRFNQGYVFGEVPRHLFEETALNLHGTRPFTMVTWVKFIGRRHMVAGIWDEGGWNKYSGRRQAALFAGLFGQRGMTAHISATGAASYPQSEASGSQYARERAIDGQAFEDNEWVMMAMAWNPDSNQVIASLDGEITPLDLTDPVVQDVYRYQTTRSANPYDFNHPIYSPRNFLLKYNGYNFPDDNVYEHRLRVDFDTGTLEYDRDGNEALLTDERFRISCDVIRNGSSILSEPQVFETAKGQTVEMSTEMVIEFGDVFSTILEQLVDSQWQRIGTEIQRQVLEGAPFTFGRALGLGSEELSHGSGIYLDGVAVFNRVLSEEELKSMDFHNGAVSLEHPVNQFIPNSASRTWLPDGWLFFNELGKAFRLDGKREQW